MIPSDKIIRALKEHPRAEVARIMRLVLGEMDAEARRSFRIGDRVEFIDKRGHTMKVTIVTVNRKTISILDDDAPSYITASWRVSPGMLTHLEKE